MLNLSSASYRVDAGIKGKLKALARWVRWHLPSGIRPHRILSGPLKGKKIVTSWRDYPAAIAGITELDLIRWFERNVSAGETWLDIGAHYGYTAIALAGLVGPSGRVFAFEPMAATAGCLSRTRYLNRLESLSVVPLALGTIEGIQAQKLSVVRGMVDSTIAPNDCGIPGQKWSETILVAQMDWLWPRIAGGNLQVDGVKIDVQGMEIDVVQGMAAILRKHRPKLALELHAGVDRKALLDLLAGVGYSRKATAIEPIAGETEAQFLDNRSYAFHPADGN